MNAVLTKRSGCYWVKDLLDGSHQLNSLVLEQVTDYEKHMLK